MTVRVVFADDNYLVREGVAGLLTETAEIDLVETVADPDALFRAVAAHQPDAVLTDIRMPPTFTTEGIDAAKRIRADHPGTGVVVLSQYVEEDYAFELLSEGVAGLGYLLKERVSQVDDLVRALYDVARGGSALDPKVVEGLLSRTARDAGSPLLGLTGRELEILQELATGRSNAATAKALFMSERAVEKHVGSVFQKLGLGNEADVNRRVKAVLTFLEATGAQPRGEAGNHTAVGGQPPPTHRRPARSWVARRCRVADVRVLIVDDQEPFRRAMGAVVEETTGFVLVGWAASGEESLVAAADLRPELVLMDVNLPGIDGIEAARRLTAAPGGPVVVLLSTYDEDQFDRTGSEAVAYVAKAAFGPDRLSEAWSAAGRDCLPGGG